MKTLTAESKSYGNYGQYIAKLTGRSAKYTYEREFVGRKSGSTSTALIDDAGLYEICDIDKKGRKDPGFVIIVPRPNGFPPLSETMMSWNASEEDAMAITKRLDKGEAIEEIVEPIKTPEGKYEYRLRTPGEAKRASAAVTVNSAIEACWAVLGALPEREAKQVLAALKLRVSPPKSAATVLESDTVPPQSTPEGPQGGKSIPLDSTCMVCGQFKPCVRAIDIGWVCLDCQGGK